MPEEQLTDQEVLMAALLMACVPECRRAAFYAGLVGSEPRGRELQFLEMKGLTVEGVRKAARVAFGYAS